MNLSILWTFLYEGSCLLPLFSERTGCFKSLFRLKVDKVPSNIETPFMVQNFTQPCAPFHLYPLPARKWENINLIKLTGL